VTADDTIDQDFLEDGADAAGARFHDDDDDDDDDYELSVDEEGTEDEEYVRGAEDGMETLRFAVHET